MKTATTTVTRTLVDHGVSWLTTLETEKISHALPAKFVEDLGEDIFEKAFIAVFVRNPYDRTVSRYEFANKQFRMQNKPTIPTFERFVKNWLWTNKIHGFQLMSRYITYNDTPIVDFVGRFENLLSDIYHLLKALKVDEVKTIPHFQKREVPYKPYQEYYTPELQDIVYETMRTDFQIFNYPYEL
jgi:hypothetical protein